MSSNIPFLRVRPLKIDNFDHTHILVILTQSLINGKYVTEKCFTMAYNGENSERPNLHRFAEARILDQHRRVQFLLIPQETFGKICVHQSASMNDIKVDGSEGYQNMVQYAEWSYAETLMELSMRYRKGAVERCLEGVDDGGRRGGDSIRQSTDGQFSVTRSAALANFDGHKMAIKFEVILCLSRQVNESLDYLQAKIWNREEDSHLEGMEESDNLGRVVLRDKQKQKVIIRNGHHFEPFLVKGVIECSNCKEPIMSVAKDKGYKCKLCGKVVHTRCTNKTFFACEKNKGAQSNDPFLQGPKNEHRFTSKKNWSLFSKKRDRHDGEKIGLFTKFYHCDICQENYKNKDTAPPDCGVDAMQMYEDIKKRKNEAVRDAATTDIYMQGAKVEAAYSKLPNLEVKEVNGELEIIANEHENMIGKLNLNQEDQDKVKEIKAKTLRKKKASAYKDFTVFKTLGEGAYGKVLLARFKRAKNENNFLAIKACRKDITVEQDLITAAYLERECLSLNHNFLVKAICTFHDPNHLFYVMEFHRGGDLYNLKKNTRGNVFKQDSVRIFGLEVLLGLRYLHRKGFLYRDVKLDNVLLGNDGHCRIADFGLVKDLNEENAETFCGTPKYMAPEILRKDIYEFPVDIWAWGVLMFVMSERTSPFTGRSQKELFQSIKWDEPQFRHATNMTRDLRDMLYSVFKKEPEERITADEILQHAYFSKHGYDYKRVENLEYEPGESPPPTDSRDFMAAFKDGASIPVSLEDDDIRSLHPTEDQIFATFAWSNTSAVALYKM